MMATERYKEQVVYLSDNACCIPYAERPATNIIPDSSEKLAMTTQGMESYKSVSLYLYIYITQSENRNTKMIPQKTTNLILIKKILSGVPK